ncbi:MAG: protein kinase [Gemmatimonadales bacterium]
MTPPAPSEKIEAAFAAALETAAANREAVIAEMLPDPSARAEVRRLLDRHFALEATGDGFLGNLDAQLAGALLEDAAPPPQTIGRYRVERRLARGGHGVVYLARDPDLDRLVAIKVLSPERASGASRARLKAEARTVSALDHPHIATIHEIGETGQGDLYVVMGYYPGETLRERLGREPVSVSEARRIATELADALAAAHGRGIVHRDVKPENVILTERGVRLVDFGIATTAGPTTGRLAPAGTVGYMSPEQARGDVVDPRSDVWALGVVLYEMLSGRRPPREPGAPPAIGPGIPEGLERLVSACLATSPDERPADGREVCRRLGAERHDDPIVPHGTGWARTSVAVLPMANTGGNPEDEPFADGLTDELIGALGKLESLSVTGRTSTFALKGKGLEVGAVAAMLRVGSLLEGSVTRADDRLRIRIQLVDPTGAVLWSHRYDRMVEDVFAVQEEIARAVARALEVRLTTSEEMLLRPPTANLAAYELYLKGRFVRRRMAPDDLVRSIDYLERAATLDPTFGRALAWLSDACFLRIVIGAGVPCEEIPRARRHANEALEQGSELAEAHWAMAQVQGVADWDWTAAERSLGRALERNPGFADARHLRAIFLLHRGRFDESMQELSRVLAVDPLQAEAHFTLGRSWLCRGEHERAVESLQEATGLQPSFGMARSYLGHAYLEWGRHDLGIAEHERAAAGGTVRERAQLAYAYARVGRRDEAAALLDGLLGEDCYLPPFQVAMAQLALGNRKEALDWLERGCAERDPWVTVLKVEPAFRPLRGERRFDAMLARIGLAR